MFYLTTHSTHFIYGYMEGRKEMFYLTTHTTHFIYGYMDGNVLFNDTLNTFYLRLYGRKEMFYLTTHTTHFIYGYMIRHMVKDHSDSERVNPLPPHGLLFPIRSKGSFICIMPQRG